MVVLKLFCEVYFSMLLKPRHGEKTVITDANSIDSDEAAHSLILARTYAVRAFIGRLQPLELDT